MEYLRKLDAGRAGQNPRLKKWGIFSFKIYERVFL